MLLSVESSPHGVTMGGALGTVAELVGGKAPDTRWMGGTLRRVYVNGVCFGVGAG